MSIGCLLLLFSKPRHEVRLCIAHNNGQVLAREHVLVIAAVTACDCLFMAVSKLLADIPAEHSSVTEPRVKLHKAEVHINSNIPIHWTTVSQGSSNCYAASELGPHCVPPYMPKT